MDFYNTIGKVAIGSRLRVLTDKITEDASNIYSLYNVNLKPKWFSVFFVLSNHEQLTITNIAKKIGHSHPSVSKIIKEMSENGIIKECKDKTDGRLNLIQLSPQGQQIAEQLSDQLVDVSAAIDTLSEQTTNDLWKAIEEWEYLLSEKSLLKRVEEERKKEKASM